MKKNTPKEIAPLPVNRLVKALTDLVKESGRKREELDPEISTHRPLIAAYEALDATNAPLVMPKDKTAGLSEMLS
jgi:hypothetical protein